MHARAAVLCAIAAACGDTPARTQFVNTTPGTCGTPAAAASITVTAFTPGGDVQRTVTAGEPADISDFPTDTEQLGVQVFDATQTLLVEGKTKPLAFLDLPNGADLDVFLAPENAFCPTNPLTVPRDSPLIARAGDGVLVVGGVGTDSKPLGSAEFYDPATASFTPVDTAPLALDAAHGFVGGVLTTLPDGRAVLTGTSRGLFAVFDPVKRAFGTPASISERVFGTAIALDDNHVLVAGGCTSLETMTGSCISADATPVTTSLVYPVDDPSAPTDGPQLAGGRAVGWLFDVGDGFVLAGLDFLGAGAGDRFHLDDPNTVPITKLDGPTTYLDGGALIATDDTTRVLPPGATAATDVAANSPVGQLVSLEDGSVLSVEGSAGFARFDPTGERWSNLVEDPSCPLNGARPLVLADGSVMVLGATPATAQACVFRPTLVGPSSGSVIANPRTGGSGVLTATDPSTLDVGTYTLTASDASLSARALVGGPKFTTGFVRAQVNLRSGGVALIAQQTAPDQAIVARFPNTGADPVTLERLGSEVACTGSVELIDGEATLQLSLDSDGTATVTRDNVAVLTCTFDAGHARGAWGLAALGKNAKVSVTSITASR